MKINKQLFEDVLSGKLNGTFVLRNGKKISSSFLSRSNCSEVFIYSLKVILTYTEFGHFYRVPGEESNRDIIDFIPDTDMKQKN